MFLTMQSLYLLDTNIISEFTKEFPNEKVLQKISEKIHHCKICAISFDEMLYGTKRLSDGKRKDKLLDFYIDFVQSKFEILPFDYHASWINSDISDKLESIGKPVSIMDSMIASIAISNNLILVTRNTKDFESIQEVSPLMLANWFEE